MPWPTTWPAPGDWRPPDPAPGERRHDRQRPGIGPPFLVTNAHSSVRTLITEAPPTASANRPNPHPAPPYPQRSAEGRFISRLSGHGTVNHSIKEYVRGGFYHSNTVENYFSILKRGVTGNYQWVSAKHLKRYLGEFDFRYNSRDVTDMERAMLAARGIAGKRLTYRRTGQQAANA